MTLTRPLEPLGLGKLHAHHLERLAVVYVRQSTVQQVHDHQESTRLQYGLAELAQRLGWPQERILIIDDDQGKSGSSTEGRHGFQRLVTEVTLDHVGLVLGLEMSRLARSNKDWHQLLDVCAVFSTLIADPDGLYDPTQYNDRLLLGLKGTMSEAELHILKQRLHQGKLSKAKRGELGGAVPIGYMRQADGTIVFDADEQVQHVVHLIFRKFEELGTLHGVLQYLVQHGIQLGVRERCLEAKGMLVWRPPNRMTLQNLLHHPMYAGAYSYGRRQIDPKRKKPGRKCTGRVVQDPRDWHVLLRDRVPAYITWEQYQANQRRLQQNRSLAESRGSARRGNALLTGLLVCGICGRRMQVRYRQGNASYVCMMLSTNYGGTSCQHLAGDKLEAWVSQQVLQALEPASLQLALSAVQRVKQERSDLDRHWQQRIERAQYEADRAQRQYMLVEPENRLVARQLEAQWEAKLSDLRVIQEGYQRFLHDRPQELTAEQLEAIAQLAHNLPVLWASSTTTAQDRKEILRAVIDRIVLRVVGESELVQVEITWVGGQITPGVVSRPVRRVEQLSTYPQVCEVVRESVAAGESTERTAERLNALQLRSARLDAWGKQAVKDVTFRLGLSRKRAHTISDDLQGRDGRWSVSALARELGMSTGTVYQWVERGEVEAERSASGRIVLLADVEKVEQLRALRARPLSVVTRERWRESLEAME